MTARVTAINDIRPSCEAFFFNESMMDTTTFGTFPEEGRRVEIETENPSS